MSHSPDGVDVIVAVVVVVVMVMIPSDYVEELKPLTMRVVVEAAAWSFISSNDDPSVLKFVSTAPPFVVAEQLRG